MDISIAISIIAVSCTLINMYWANKKTVKGDGNREGVLLSDLGYVKSGVDDLKNELREIRNEQKEIRDDIAKLNQEYAEVESSVKSAHHRIDEINTRLNSASNINGGE